MLPNRAHKLLLLLSTEEDYHDSGKFYTTDSANCFCLLIYQFTEILISIHTQRHSVLLRVRVDSHGQGFMLQLGRCIQYANPVTSRQVKPSPECNQHVDKKMVSEYLDNLCIVSLEKANIYV